MLNQTKLFFIYQVDVKRAEAPTERKRTMLASSAVGRVDFDPTMPPPPIHTPARSATQMIGELASNLADVFGRRCSEDGHVDSSMSPKFSRDEDNLLQMQRYYPLIRVFFLSTCRFWQNHDYFSRKINTFIPSYSPPMEKKLHDAVSHATATSEDSGVATVGVTQRPRLTMRVSTNATASVSRDKKKSTDKKSKPKKDDKKSKPKKDKKKKKKEADILNAPQPILNDMGSGILELDCE